MLDDKAGGRNGALVGVGRVARRVGKISEATNRSPIRSMDAVELRRGVEIGSVHDLMCVHRAERGLLRTAAKRGKRCVKLR